MSTARAAATDADRGSQRVWVWGAGAIVLLGILAAWFFLPVQEWMTAFNGWIEGLGVWGYLIFAIAYVIGTIVLAPGAVFTLAAGLTFGLWGFPLTVVAATLGATLAFLIARYIAQDAVRRAIDKRPNLQAADRAISEEGWKVVALLRLSPVIPFNLQNYALGVTDIPLWQYVAATFFGIMPGALLYTYLGAAGKAAGGEGGGSTLQYVFFGIGLLATVAVTVYVTVKAKAKLQQSGVADKSQKG